MKKSLRFLWLSLGLAALSGPPSGRAATVDVAIANFAFSPPNVTIHVGDAVRWTQSDSVSHTTTSGTTTGGVRHPDGLWNSGLMSPGQTFSHTFNSAGVFPYYCSPHFTSMTGTVTVPGANVPPTVALTSPADGASFPRDTAITLQATASDSDGSVTQVQFFDGTDSLGVVTASPYTLSVSLLPGSHSLTAAAGQMSEPLLDVHHRLVPLGVYDEDLIVKGGNYGWNLKEGSFWFDPATMAHIHGPASTSVSGGVLISLAPFAISPLGVQGDFAGVVVLTDAQKALILGGQTYVNVHTAGYPAGEVRGQLAPVLMQVALSGANSRSDPVITVGAGLGTLALLGNQLTFQMAYQGLSGAATAAHIHGPTNAAYNAGVQVDLAPSNGGAFGSNGILSGSVTLTPSQLAWLIDGLTYVNVPTSAQPAGEIRGQLASIWMVSSLAGGNEQPAPVVTDGYGSGAFALVIPRLAKGINPKKLKPAMAETRPRNGPGARSWTMPGQDCQGDKPSNATRI